MSTNSEIKTECYEEEELQNPEDNEDYIAELIRGAQAIIEEYRSEASNSTDILSSPNISFIPEELSRQVEEILTDESIALVANELESANVELLNEISDLQYDNVDCQNENVDLQNENIEQLIEHPAIVQQNDDDDDDVIFISAEPIIPACNIIDLCSPAGDFISRRRRRRINEVIEVDILEDTTAKRTSTPPNLNVSAETPTSGDTLKLTCAVCMDNPTKRQPMATVCGHIFCKQCITQAIKCTRKCPLCNKKLSKVMAHRIYL